MARSLYQTLMRCAQPAPFSTKLPSNSYAVRLVSLRTQSSQADSQRSADPGVVDSDGDQREAMAVKSIEDAIHRIIVRRSAPDWLPFVPGASYWVPPRKESYGIAQLVDKMSNSLSDEEVMSLTTSRGWPSSSFFLSDESPDPVEVEETFKELSQSEDKHG